MIYSIVNVLRDNCIIILVGRIFLFFLQGNLKLNQYLSFNRYNYFRCRYVYLVKITKSINYIEIQTVKNVVIAADTQVILNTI